MLHKKYVYSKKYALSTVMNEGYLNVIRKRDCLAQHQTYNNLAPTQKIILSNMYQDKKIGIKFQLHKQYKKSLVIKFSLVGTYNSEDTNRQMGGKKVPY